MDLLTLKLKVLLVVACVMVTMSLVSSVMVNMWQWWGVRYLEGPWFSKLKNDNLTRNVSKSTIPHKDEVVGTGVE